MKIFLPIIALLVVAIISYFIYECCKKKYQREPIHDDTFQHKTENTIQDLDETKNDAIEKPPATFNMSYSSVGIPLKMPCMGQTQDGGLWNSVNLRDLFSAEGPNAVEANKDGGVTRYRV